MCQSHPRSSATSDTACSWGPTCNPRLPRRPPRRPGRHRTTARGDRRVLPETGRPKHGRSTSTTSRFLCRRDGFLHLQGGRSAREVISIRSHFGPSPTLFTITSGSPDKQRAHARRIRFHRGLLGSTTLDTVRLAEPLNQASGTYPEPLPPPRDPKSLLRFTLRVQRGYRATQPTSDP